MIERTEEGRLFAEVIELPGCITYGNDMDHLLERVKMAIQLYLGREEKLVITDEFIGVQKILAK